MAVDDSGLERKARVRLSVESGNCPDCGVEMEHESVHERDSSNDRHFCPKCMWEYGEMETWGL